MIEVFIAVGSNIEPDRNIPEAVLLAAEDLPILAVSPFYRSQAIDRPGDPDFANGVFAARTDLSARDVKNVILRGIESRLGRVRSGERYAPRPIDLDLILYGDVVSDAPEIALPDPEILERPCIAVPLAEIAPFVRHPVTGERFAEIATRLGRTGLRPWPEIRPRVEAWLRGGRPR
ncbi:MAG: 2-amino-4-hydroxy-6-hydroxymethyldihydropteridine diphosphokinase [Planctomycetes bacterium]|nr:2-amino-4-hydroxy-6-hydroxymethyldihydropteridine diphosphokinase [Planctomycetota bacterium]